MTLVSFTEAALKNFSKLPQNLAQRGILVWICCSLYWLIWSHQKTNECTQKVDFFFVHASSMNSCFKINYCRSSLMGLLTFTFWSFTLLKLLFSPANLRLLFSKVSFCYSMWKVCASYQWEGETQDTFCKTLLYCTSPAGTVMATSPVKCACGRLFYSTVSCQARRWKEKRQRKSSLEKIPLLIQYLHFLSVFSTQTP